MYLIAGLGNPGREYEDTRHNVGFTTLDLIAHSLDLKINKVKFKGLLGEGSHEGRKLLLLKPQTYMNLSGESVKDALNFYKIPPEKLIVIYDDMDLPLGRIRIRPEGSAGGHRGMESIIYQLASDKFPRVRIGIGRPEGERDAAGHVLGRFYGEEIDKIRAAIRAAAEAALMIVAEGVDRAMNKYNGFEA
ncbi:MAG: aminoacyl-tRNA hydrolase [Tepidanaerobacteraceae bacterium]|nr:aminoacyl-tRNA hydrolase [Tepidanaerobacter sp.]HQA59409.1 aminoacyl-tRNA hydrolase [Tepidanaerobacteraceae bacterium]